jgi:cytochrome c oxidase subunit 2
MHMRRDVVSAVVIWAIVSVASVGVAAFVMDPFPAVGAEEATLIDDAFMVMTYMGAPVFAIVIAVLIYAVYKWRATGTPEEGDDGQPILGTGWFPKAWLGATSALAVVVMIYPGLTGLAELRSDDTAELRIEIQALSWQWLVNYPDQGIRISSGAGDELVLPDDTRIQFDVTALDILHSFWIPAFRQKIDAVPGQTTHLYTTLTGTGDFEQDAAYRIQCAELCGLNHTDMSMKVRVLERDEWDQWVDSKTAAAAEVR